ncbi:MAG: family N-acetyltransferase [Sphingobacteriales bacterium]|nr:family N-acetyltransferase [Sphingobacteriales bacterium]
MINITRTNSSDRNFKNLINELDNDLKERYSNYSYKYDTDIQVDELETVTLARINEITIGCGCFKEISEGTVEIKRMFVNPYFRGLGISYKILKELLIWAKELHYTNAVLETGSEQQESISLYKTNGFVIIPNFGPYIDIPESICMVKASNSQ